MDHQWTKFGNDKDFSAVVCNKCAFVVLATTQMPGVEKGKSYYFKAYRLIVLGATALDNDQADQLCRRYKARCP